jgi:ATP-dependent Zn protease
MRFGMSEKVGPVLHKDEDLGTLSPETRFVIEEEVKSILEVRERERHSSCSFFYY